MTNFLDHDNAVEFLSEIISDEDRISAVNDCMHHIKELSKENGRSLKYNANMMIALSLSAFEENEFDDEVEHKMIILCCNIIAHRELTLIKAN